MFLALPPATDTTTSEKMLLVYPLPVVLVMALALDISNAQSSSPAPSDSDLPSTVGRSCSATNNHLDALSHKLISDCDPKSFCSSATNGTCQPRVCRRDEFAYGYLPDEAIPSLCPAGAFCPDDGSGCVEQREVGGMCEMGRDEQCGAMQGWDSEGSGLGDRMNTNGSVCLKGVCAYVLPVHTALRLLC